MRKSILSFSFFVFLAAALPLQAQFAPPPASTPVHDSTALQPPQGSRVAIIDFEDLQCPDCAHANPLLQEAAAKYKIPLVRHDFPLPRHSWAMPAAVNARWFDTQSETLGNQYRDAIFAAQPTITGRDALQLFTQQFAASHKIDLPTAIDPNGTLAALVKADLALGKSIGLQHTPTIWVVTAFGNGAPFVEVVDRGQLFQMLEQALTDTAQAIADTKRAPHDLRRHDEDEAPRRNRRLARWQVAGLLRYHRQSGAKHQDRRALAAGHCTRGSASAQPIPSWPWLSPATAVRSSPPTASEFSSRAAAKAASKYG